MVYVITEHLTLGLLGRRPGADVACPAGVLFRKFTLHGAVIVIIRHHRRTGSQSSVGIDYDEPTPSLTTRSVARGKKIVVFPQSSFSGEYRFPRVLEIDDSLDRSLELCIGSVVPDQPFRLIRPHCRIGGEVHRNSPTFPQFYDFGQLFVVPGRNAAVE